MVIDNRESTPFGTLRYAENYRIAGEKVIGDCNPLESELLMPAYNLIAQSIELSLKAYLLTTGMMNSELRSNNYGHKLSVLIDKAESLGMGNLVSLDRLDRHLVASLSAHYETHEFRYIRTGYKTLPFWSDITLLAKKLTHELHDYCLVLRMGEEEARQRIASCGKF